MLRALENGQADLRGLHLPALASLYRLDLAALLKERVPLTVDLSGGVIATAGLVRTFTPGGQDGLLLAYLHLVRDLRDLQTAPSLALRRVDVEVLATSLRSEAVAVLDRLGPLMGSTVPQRRSAVSLGAGTPTTSPVTAAGGPEMRSPSVTPGPESKAPWPPSADVPGLDAPSVDVLPVDPPPPDQEADAPGSPPGSSEGDGSTGSGSDATDGTGDEAPGSSTKEVEPGVDPVLADDDADGSSGGSPGNSQAAGNSSNVGQPGNSGNANAGGGATDVGGGNPNAGGWSGR